MDDAAADRLARLLGIADGYRDMTGGWTATSLDARRNVAAALGFPSATAGEAADSLGRLTARLAAPVPPLITAPANQPALLVLESEPGAWVEWRLTDESGTVREDRATVEAGDGRRWFRLPASPMGYHHLALRTATGRDAEATLIAAPPGCRRPEPPRRRWGLTGAAYALSSARDLCIGGFREIGALAEEAGRRGADFLGLMPLHALFAADRSKISPYAPSSRLFLETIHIDPAQVPGFGGAATELMAAAEESGTITALRADPLVDHAAAWALKRPILDAAWAEFDDRSGSFAGFRRAGGGSLETHATFEALSEALQEQGYASAAEWPAAYLDPTSAQLAAFRREQADLVAFHAWLQWLADEQLKAAAARAAAGGMTIGLYRDLAVGADPLGSEIWSAPERFARRLSIGAPPDPLGPQGQDWGVPPFHPLALEDAGLAPFRALVAANMRHAGALRIDHAFQLRRLYLLPAGGAAAEGAYVSYPTDALMAALRIESHRAGTLVIGEDLGTAPDAFPETLAGSGLYGYRVLYFERETDGGFRPPEAYPQNALAVVNTHDLPTFAGWWRGHDIADRLRFGITDEAAAATGFGERERDRAGLAALLAREGLLPPGEVPPDPPTEAVARLLARTPAELAGLQLEDITGAVEQANIPGLAAGPPNWRRRLPASLEELLAPDGPLDRFAAAMAAEGRGR